MSTHCFFVEELSFISDRLRQVFERESESVTAEISFKEVQEFQRQIRPWDKSFVRPPKSLVATCRLEVVKAFYRRRLDFSIFQGFNKADLATIEEEVAAYVAREALDSLIGYRLRNWAAIGLRSPKWPLYQELVRDYYERTISEEKQQRIEALEQYVTERTALTPTALRAKYIGELFFEIDKIRRMTLNRFEKYLGRIREQSIGHGLRREGRELPLKLNIPEELQDSFQLFGFTRQINFRQLKERYRQLALNHHPDKGGSLEMMKRLNTAYQQIANHLRQEEAREFSRIS